MKPLKNNLTRIILHCRHPPTHTNYLVDAAAAQAAAAGKSMRTTPQPIVPVSLTGSGLTIGPGRSSSPASRAPSNYQPSGLGQRVLPSAGHDGQVRYVPFPTGTTAGSPFAALRDVRDPTAYLRGNVSVFFFFSSHIFLRLNDDQPWRALVDPLILRSMCFQSCFLFVHS